MILFLKAANCFHLSGFCCLLRNISDENKTVYTIVNIIITRQIILYWIFDNINIY